MILHWGPSPEIFSLGPLSIRWYGLLFASGFMIGYRIMDKVFRREGYNREHLDHLLLYLILGTTIGARLGHCLFYEPEIYLRDPLRILAIWEGGLASHGGTLGNFFSLWLFVRRFKEFDYIWLIDRLSYPIALVSCFIRLGNVMNSEILGKPTNSSWGVVFDHVDSIPRYPAQLFEAIIYLLTFFLMRYLYDKTKAWQYRGRMFGIFFCCIFGSRFFIELVKENQVPFENALPLNMGQLLSIPFVLLGIGFIIYSRTHRVEPALTAKKKKK
ncbi:MAG: prolipoprotein diacylglyceryl transferase [Bdellovibrionales bacterium]